MNAFLLRHRRILGEAGWVFFGQAASAVATLVGLRLITEVVSPAIYGTVALALGVVALAQGLAVGPLMQAVLRYYPEAALDGREGGLRRATANALRRPLLIASGVLAASAIAWAWAQPQQRWLAMLTLALFLAETARSVQITFLNAARRQRAMALLVMADAWLRPLGAVACVWASGPSEGAVMAGYLLGAALPLVAYRVTARRRGAPTAATTVRPEAVGDLAHRLRAYAWPLTALPLIGWVSGQADRYIVGAMAGVAAAGSYAALYGLASKPFLMLSASAELTLRQPFYARLSVADHRGAQRALAVWAGGVVAAALAMALLLLLFHAEFAGWLLAAEYRAHSALMAWIGAGYVLLAAAQVFERVCYACHDTRGVLGVQTAGAILSVALAAPLVWRFGIEGAAWAVPAYFGAQMLLTVARARSAWRRTLANELPSNPIVAASPARQ
jgi:O-antigen/teichoic acid export membrane protein